MREKAILVLISALSASLIRVSWTYEVELVTSPGGPVVSPEPQFNTTFEKVTVYEGGSVAALCTAAGERPITYRWYDEDRQSIPENPDLPVYVSSAVNGAWLNFKQVELRHEGLYTCAAANDHGLKTKLYQLIVLNKTGPEPEFDAPFENMNVTEGERVEAFCTATGETPISYKWYNETSDLIPENPNLPVYVSSSVNGSWLNIKEMKLRHEGVYICTAENTHASKRKIYKLTVLPRTEDENYPYPVIQNISVANVSANGVTFRIVFSGLAKRIQVNIRERRSPRSYMKVYPITSDDMFTIWDLVPSGAYSFQFRILPAMGRDFWPKRINVTLLPDVPELIFRSIENGNVYLEWFRTSQDEMRGTIDRYEVKYYTVEMDLGGNYWVPSSCPVTIQIPFCYGTKYKISGLKQNSYHMIEVRAHTDSGYGEPARQKIYVSG